MNHATLGEIRPRFALKIDMDPEEALNIMETDLYADKTVYGERSNTLIFLRVPSWERHYWSPEMTVRIEVEEFTDYTTVSCLVGPRQTVWAMFMFIYAAIALVTLFGGIFGYIEYSRTGSSPWLWIIPIGVIALSTVFLTASIGQRKGRDQMLHLISFAYHSLDKVTRIERLERT